MCTLDFADLSSSKLTEKLAEALDVTVTSQRLSDLSVLFKELRKQSNEYNNGSMLEGGFSNSHKEVEDWTDLKPKNALQVMKKRLLIYLVQKH